MLYKIIPAEYSFVVIVFNLYVKKLGSVNAQSLRVFQRFSMFFVSYVFKQVFPSMRSHKNRIFPMEI